MLALLPIPLLLLANLAHGAPVAVASPRCVGGADACSRSVSCVAGFCGPAFAKKSSLANVFPHLKYARQDDDFDFSGGDDSGDDSSFGEDDSGDDFSFEGDDQDAGDTSDDFSGDTGSDSFDSGDLSDPSSEDSGDFSDPSVDDGGFSDFDGDVDQSQDGGDDESDAVDDGGLSDFGLGDEGEDTGDVDEGSDGDLDLGSDGDLDAGQDGSDGVEDTEDAGDAASDDGLDSSDDGSDAEGSSNPNATSSAADPSITEPADDQDTTDEGDDSTSTTSDVDPDATSSAAEADSTSSAADTESTPAAAAATTAAKSASTTAAKASSDSLTCDGSASPNAATISLIKQFEGFVPSPAPDPIGLATVGFGHKCTSKSCAIAGFSFPLSQTTATQLLNKDLQQFVSCVNSAVSNSVTLTDNQLGALTSFSFNLGCGTLKSSTLLKRLNAGEDPNTVAAAEIPRFNKAGGKVLAGLTKRRAAEVALFQTASQVKAHPC